MTSNLFLGKYYVIIPVLKEALKHIPTFGPRKDFGEFIVDF